MSTFGGSTVWGDSVKLPNSRGGDHIVLFDNAVRRGFSAALLAVALPVSVRKAPGLRGVDVALHVVKRGRF